MSMDSILKPLRDNWIVLAALIGSGVAWGVNTASLAGAQTKVIEQNQLIEKHEERIKKVEEAVIRIETTSEFTQRDIADIKEMLRKELERRASQPR